jgi:nucleotide-binding universal stress UspA family protein
MSANPDTRSILLCYDGSEDAATAIEQAAAIFSDRYAVSVCFWQPFAQVAKRFAISLLEVVQEASSVNEREEAFAKQVADEGAAIATRAGLSCVGLAVEVSRPIDEAIIAYADEIDAPVIVLGARGRSAVGSMLLGDVAHDVVQRSTRAVLLVPSGPLSGRRRTELGAVERDATEREA